MKKCLLVLTMTLLLGVSIPLKPSQAAENYPNDFKLLQHNVFLLPKLVSSWGQDERTKYMSNADYFKGHDALLLNELFDNGNSDILLKNLSNEYPYQTPVLGRSKTGWDETRGSYSNVVPEDGGVAIVSKWPIVEKIQHVYANGCGADYYANKGFVYAKVQKEDKFYHLISTHAQAEDTGCHQGEGAKIRHTQFQELNDFIKSKNIPKEEVIFIGGDFNVIKNDTTEYNSMLSTLNVNPPAEYLGHTSTWDPETNSITGYKYPDYAPQHLDYIFVEKDHKQPSPFVNETITPKSPTWKAIYEYNDYSDHYPVKAYVK
ncbi:sphingomyelin phosphodiesterase [Bacillus massilinigeriensis]|uniref:sphingomyelin phosphodiesterase n=1 Tax=Bacillus mediterraneensis TaxID=1805474 RepID=UPI000B0BCB0A|nr:sphingomyelin phosphodiesterase [Bacillus mediterraneensis]